MHSNPKETKTTKLITHKNQSRTTITNEKQTNNNDQMTKQNKMIMIHTTRSNETSNPAQKKKPSPACVSISLRAYNRVCIIFAVRFTSIIITSTYGVTRGWVALSLWKQIHQCNVQHKDKWTEPAQEAVVQLATPLLVRWCMSTSTTTTQTVPDRHQKDEWWVWTVINELWTVHAGFLQFYRGVVMNGTSKAHIPLQALRSVMYLLLSR